MPVKWRFGLGQPRVTRGGDNRIDIIDRPIRAQKTADGTSDSLYGTADLLERPTVRKLRWCNFGAGLFHLAVFIAVLAVAYSRDGVVSAMFPVYCTRNHWCVGNARLWCEQREKPVLWANDTVALANCGSTIDELCATPSDFALQFQALGKGVGLFPEVYECTSISMLALTAAFFALSFTFHMINFFRSYDFKDGSWLHTIACRGNYIHELRQGYSPSRWIEYCFSASCMIILIVYFTGVQMLSELVCFFVLTFATQYFGYAAEHLATSESVWQRLKFHLLGWCTLLPIIVLTVAQFVSSASGTNIPSFVYVLVIVEFSLFSCFSFVQLWQLRLCGCFDRIDCCRRWRRCCCGFCRVGELADERQDVTIQGEFTFIVLSFVCKFSLGMISLTNVLVSNVFDEFAPEDA